MTDAPINGVAVLSRVRDVREPHVPSVRVRCDRCDAWCWLDKDVKAHIEDRGGTVYPVCGQCWVGEGDALPELVREAMSGRLTLLDSQIEAVRSRGHADAADVLASLQRLARERRN